jgi:uncharacterized protein
MDLSLELLLMLAAVAAVAGFVDAVAGGGGLITIPALLLAGVPPVMAVATNKLQGTIGTLTSTLAFARAGHVDLKGGAGIAIFAFAGSIVGGMLATVLPSTWLAALMPLILVLVAVYFLFSSTLADRALTPRVSAGTFRAAFVPVIGVYDGFFGPGAGSFYMAGLVALRGMSAVPATGLTKYLNLASNLGALLFFLAAGKVVISVGLAMGAGQFFGAQFGARSAIRAGSRLIRPLLVITCVAMAIRLMVV